MKNKTKKCREKQSAHDILNRCHLFNIGIDFPMKIIQRDCILYSEQSFGGNVMTTNWFYLLNALYVGFFSWF